MFAPARDVALRQLPQHRHVVGVVADLAQLRHRPRIVGVESAQAIHLRAPVRLGVVAQVPRKTNQRTDTRQSQPAPEPTPPDTQQPVETIKIDTNLVTVPVIAADINGLYLPDLRQDEFNLWLASAAGTGAFQLMSTSQPDCAAYMDPRTSQCGSAAPNSTHYETTSINGPTTSSDLSGSTYATTITWLAS